LFGRNRNNIITYFVVNLKTNVVTMSFLKYDNLVGRPTMGELCPVRLGRPPPPSSNRGGGTVLFARRCSPAWAYSAECDSSCGQQLSPSSAAMIKNGFSFCRLDKFYYYYYYCYYYNNVICRSIFEVREFAMRTSIYNIMPCVVYEMIMSVK